MICGISKMLICLISTGEVAKQVYANIFKTYIWVAVAKYKRLLCQKTLYKYAQQGNTWWAAYRFLLHR